MHEVVIGRCEGGIPAGAFPGEAKRQQDKWLKQFDGIEEAVDRDIILEKLDKIYQFRGSDTEYKDGWSRSIEIPQLLKELEEIFDEHDLIPQLIRALVAEYTQNKRNEGSVLLSCENCGDTKRIALESCAQCSRPDIKETMQAVGVAAADMWLLLDQKDPKMMDAWRKFQEAWRTLNVEL